MAPNSYEYADYYAYSENYYDDYDSFSPAVKFCGDPLWIEQTFGKLKSTFEIPIFTWCFNHAILAQIPVLFFFIAFPILWMQMKTAPRIGPLPYDWLASMKYALAVIMAGDKFSLLIKSLYQWIFQGYNVPIIEFLYPILNVLALICIILTMERCRNYGLISPGILFCTWTLFVVCGIPEFYVWIKLGTDPKTVNEIDFFRYLAYLIWYPIVCVELFLNFFSDNTFNSQKTNIFPENRASFISRQMFFWFSKLAKLSDPERILPAERVFEIIPPDHAEILFNKWKVVWAQQIKKKKPLGFSDAAHRHHHNLHYEQHDDGVQVGGDNDVEPLISTNKKQLYGSLDSELSSADEKPTKSRDPSIIHALIRLFKWQVLRSAIFKLLADLTQFVGPLFLIELLAFVEGDGRAALWYGCGVAMGMFVCAELTSLFYNNYYIVTSKVCVGVQSVLASAVYDKVLRLSNARKREDRKKELLNLMANDVANFEAVFVHLIHILSIPFQIIIGLFLLYQIVGWAASIAAIFMLFAAFCNVIFTNGEEECFDAYKKESCDRLSLTSEFLDEIFTVKILSCERPLTRLIQSFREREIRHLKDSKIYQNAILVLNASTTFLTAFLTFAFYAVINSSRNYEFTATLIFVTLFLIILLQTPFLKAATLFSQMIQLINSNKRLKKFLMEVEVDQTAVERDSSPAYERAIDIQFATFDWSDVIEKRYQHSSEIVQFPHTLNNVELHVKRGILVVVAGGPGAGKSSLLSAILGEMHKLYGYVGVRGRIAYCPRRSWILNRSIRSNIVMDILDDDMTFESEKYESTLRACGLKTILETLPEKDLTVIGDENDANLARNFKLRIALARAIYHTADIYLFDDLFSAVHKPMAKTLFENVVGPNSILAGRTRILVSNSEEFMQNTDLVVFVDEKKIKFIGTYKEMEMLESPGQPGFFDAIKPNALKNNIIENVEHVSASALENACEAIDFQLKTSIEETKRTHPGFSFHVDYVNAAKYHAFTIAGIFLLGSLAFAIINQYWLSDWANPESYNAKMLVIERFAIYFGIGILIALSLAAALGVTLMGTTRASIRIFNRFLASVMHASLAFSDVAFRTRIFYRFSKDFETIDWKIGNRLQLIMLSLANVTFILAIFFIRKPFLIILELVVLIAGLSVVCSFVYIFKQLQRLTCISRYSLFIRLEETVDGLLPIRASQLSATFSKAFGGLINNYLACKYLTMISLRWLNIRMELVGNIFLFLIALLAVVSTHFEPMTPAFVGLFVITSYQVANIFSSLAKNIGDFESEVSSVARVKEFFYLPPEVGVSTRELASTLPLNWPDRGEIVIENLSCRLLPQFDFCLEGVNAKISAGEKIGVVGGKKSGKNLLLFAMLRFSEAENGRILIDGVDISELGLHELRSRIGVILQKAVVFSGSLRFNLDPDNLRSDAELWAALEKVNLKEFVESKHTGLDTHISKSNISEEHRLLICLARVVLQRSSVVLIDGLSFAGNSKLESVIGNIMQSEFSHATIICDFPSIANALDCDRFMVMEAGKLVEFDTPSNLLASPNSLFYKLYSEEQKE